MTPDAALAYTACWPMLFGLIIGIIGAVAWGINDRRRPGIALVSVGLALLVVAVAMFIISTWMQVKT